MTKQSEAILEQNLINQLLGLGYQQAVIPDGVALVANLKKQLELFNKLSFSHKEFDTILNHIEKGNVFEKAKTLRGRFQFTNDTGEATYIQFFNSEDWTQNHFQVTNQITQEGILHE
jgi:type I restriction enzyme R subunit